LNASIRIINGFPIFVVRVHYPSYASWEALVSLVPFRIWVIGTLACSSWYMLFELNSKIITELVTVVFATVPDLLLVLLDVSLSIQFLPLTLLLLVVVKLGLESVVLEGVFWWHLFWVCGAMGRIRFDEFFNLLLELSFSLVYGDGLRRIMWNLTGVGRAYILRTWIIISRGGRVELIQSIFLENGKLKHFFLEVVLFVLVVICYFWENIRLFFLAFRCGAAYCIGILHFWHQSVIL